MRGIFYLFTLLLVGAVGCRSNKSVVKESGHIISISDSTLLYGGADTIKFGKMQSGEAIRKQLWIKNVSSKNIVLNAYHTTCRCTILDYDKKPISPNKGKKAFLTYDSRGFSGWQFKVIRIEFAGSKKPYRIYIEADIE